MSCKPKNLKLLVCCQTPYLLSELTLLLWFIYCTCFAFHDQIPVYSVTSGGVLCLLPAKDAVPKNWSSHANGLTLMLFITPKLLYDVDRNLLLFSFFLQENVLEIVVFLEEHQTLLYASLSSWTFYSVFILSQSFNRFFNLIMWNNFSSFTMIQI